MVGFLFLVVGHGIHDAFHDEAGAAICIALTLGLAATRIRPPVLSPVVERVIDVVVPAAVTVLAPVFVDARGSPDAVVPLRL